MSHPAPAPKIGDRVTFKGGTGRSDEDAIYEGIVNGQPFSSYRSGAGGAVTYVPVHVQPVNHNVIVALPNIVSVGEDAA